MSATTVSSLQTLRDTYITTISDLLGKMAAIDTAIADLITSPQPSYSLDGEAVDWNSYYAILGNQLAQLGNALRAAQDGLLRINQIINQNQPYQYISKVV